jgi:glutamine amidotransferase
MARNNGKNDHQSRGCAQIARFHELRTGSSSCLAGATRFSRTGVCFDEAGEQMCRALIYLGQPILLDDLLFQPDSALINQVYTPKMLNTLSLAGFGMLAWDRRSYSPGAPYRYSSPTLPVFDRNLKSLAQKTWADCVLAHVRGVAYSTSVNISDQNCHPFHFPGMKVALAHNGDIYRIGEIRGTLLNHIKTEYARHIAGSTDSEWLYALLLSRLPDPWREPAQEELVTAVEELIDILRWVRRRHGIDISSSCNLFIATGAQVLGLRYCFDFGRFPTESPDAAHESDLSYLSMWFTLGREFGFHYGEWQMVGGLDSATSALIASEPLSSNTAHWLQVPEYGLVHAENNDGRPRVEVRAISV